MFSEQEYLPSEAKHNDEFNLLNDNYLCKKSSVMNNIL